MYIRMETHYYHWSRVAAIEYIVPFCSPITFCCKLKMYLCKYCGCISELCYLNKKSRWNLFLCVLFVSHLHCSEESDYFLYTFSVISLQTFFFQLQQQPLKVTVKSFRWSFVAENAHGQRGECQYGYSDRVDAALQKAADRQETRVGWWYVGQLLITAHSRGAYLDWIFFLDVNYIYYIKLQTCYRGRYRTKWQS